MQLKKVLSQFGLVAAALGFVFGHSASEFILSLVEDAIMPVIQISLNIEDWKTHSVKVASNDFEWGHIVKNLIRLVIVWTSVILILQWLEREN
ncbi:MscL family protein [Paracoccaceae bacterium]|nr:MscL family protein [Paracoccaceae bacterium]